LDTATIPKVRSRLKTGCRRRKNNSGKSGICSGLYVLRPLRNTLEDGIGFFAVTDGYAQPDAFGAEI